MMRHLLVQMAGVLGLLKVTNRTRCRRFLIVRLCARAKSQHTTTTTASASASGGSSSRATYANDGISGLSPSDRPGPDPASIHDDNYYAGQPGVNASPNMAKPLTVPSAVPGAVPTSTTAAHLPAAGPGTGTGTERDHMRHNQPWVLPYRSEYGYLAFGVLMIPPNYYH